MTGYVFHCTPCGNSHAGECPPRKAAQPQPWTVEIAVGSRWRSQNLDSDGNWQLGVNRDGYEVVSLITDGDIKHTFIQVVAWDSKLGPVYTLEAGWWSEDGIQLRYGGGRARMVPWT